MTTSRRDHLVDTALKLFCRQGIRATGIDTVLSESGVAKKTLYNHFKSKDELVIAALQQRDRDFLDTMRAGIARLAPSQPGDSRMHRPLAFLRRWESGLRAITFTAVRLSTHLRSIRARKTPCMWPVPATKTW